MTVADVAALGEQLDRFCKRSYADGYDLIAVRVDENGDLDLKAPLLRGIEDFGV